MRFFCHLSIFLNLEDVMYSIVDIKGKQYKVETGKVISVDHIAGEVGSVFDEIKVLLLKKEQDVKIGTPYLDNVKVIAKIKEQKKDPKIKVVHFKSKANIRTVNGHRQQKTDLIIESIS